MLVVDYATNCTCPPWINLLPISVISDKGEKETIFKIEPYPNRLAYGLFTRPETAIYWSHALKYKPLIIMRPEVATTGCVLFSKRSEAKYYLVYCWQLPEQK